MWSSSSPTTAAAPPPSPVGVGHLPPPPAVPPPQDPNLKRRIDTLALFAARNGPDFVDYTRRQQRGNDEFEFLEGGEGASYFDFKLYEAVMMTMAVQQQQHEEAEATMMQQRGEEAAEASRRSGRQELGGQELHHHHQNQTRTQTQTLTLTRPQRPSVDVFELPAGLIPELVNAARTRDASSCKPLTPISAAEAEAAARVAEAEFPRRKIFGRDDDDGDGGDDDDKDDSDDSDNDSETDRALSSKLSTPYLSARLAALEAELEAYVPGMTRADLEEKLARARGFCGQARGGYSLASSSSSWEDLMRRRAAEAAAAAATRGARGGVAAVAPGAPPGDDGRFEGPRWLDRAGVGFEYNRNKNKNKKSEGSGGGGAFAFSSSAAAAAAAGGGGGDSSAEAVATAADPASLLLDADLASFREERSRQYHLEGDPRRRRRGRGERGERRDERR